MILGIKDASLLREISDLTEHLNNPRITWGGSLGYFLFMHSELNESAAIHQSEQNALCVRDTSSLLGAEGLIIFMLPVTSKLRGQNINSLDSF